MFHLSFSFWLCPDAENRKKRIRGWDSFLLLSFPGNSDTHYPRIIWLSILINKTLYSFLLLIFKDDKIFSIFPSLKSSKKGFCLWGPHLIFSVSSPLLKEGKDSEASSHVCAPSDRPCVLDRAQTSASAQRLSPALLICPIQMTPDMRMWLMIQRWELCSPAEIPNSLNNPIWGHEITVGDFIPESSTTPRWSVSFKGKHSLLNP